MSWTSWLSWLMPKKKASGIHDAARVSRNRTYPLNAKARDSSRDMTEYDRKRLVALARWVVANIGLAQGTANKLGQYAVGTKWEPQAETQDEAWNQQAEDLWREWSKVCDIRGQSTFPELARMWSREEKIDGEVFVVLQNREFPLLQTVRTHRIGNPSGVPRNDVAPGWIDGIRYNAMLRPEAYRYLVDRDKAIVLPSRAVIHIQRNDQQADQLRGVTRFVRALNNIKDLGEIYGFEKMAVKLNAAIAVVIQSRESGDDTTGFGREPAESDGTSSENLPDVRRDELYDGALIQRLDPDEELSAHHFQRPDESVQELARWLIRDLATGFDLPYEFIWSAEGMGSAQTRFVISAAGRTIEQEAAMLAKASQRIWNWRMAIAMNQGQLPRSDEWWRVMWQGPRNITIDAGREAQQMREDLKMGLRTHRQDAAERGTHWRDERTQQMVELQDLLTRARELDSQFGIGMDAAVNLLQQRNPNPAIEDVDGPTEP